MITESSGAQRVTKQSPIPIMERKGNPQIDFLLVIMAGSIARGRVHTTTTELLNIVYYLFIYKIIYNFVYLFIYLFRFTPLNYKKT